MRQIRPKTGRFRLFDIHAEGLGTGMVTHPGLLSIGIIS